ncbi:MAG: TaqI-like C-terminal specificity domain-containing protein, partial [Ignavibacteria bacterium]|nr:TaqI-like C-terminal specificity domain-containing protein [Ignavibacteria bacterium]
GFITMYMCRETIRKSVIQKFNETKGWNCNDINSLYDKIEDRSEANKIVNDIKICDPAVGSGHFLVSALNEMIAIKSDLKILQDRDGRRLKEYHFEVVNDELIVTDEDGELFEYNPTNKESQRIQETLFHEKQTIIENCLFGVDINPNSVKICRLRLWIELLKNAYYKNETELETLPNIDINIKCGNSLISRFALNAELKQALRKSASKWTIDGYRIAVDTYRNAQSKEQKREMERLINEIKTNFRSEISANDPKVKKLYKLNGELFQMTNQGQLFEMSKKEKTEWNKKVSKLTEDTRNLESEIEAIKSNKIYENAFEWRFEFPEVLDDNGDFIGFDVVIGNPPWGAELHEQELKFIKSWNNDIVVRMIDTFMFFINLSFIIKSKEGLVCQIIPDVLLYQLDNIKLRKKILNNYQLLIVANLGDNIFEDVARPSCIIQIGNKSYKPETHILEYSAKDKINIDDIVPSIIPTSFFSGLPNTLFATRNLEGYNLLNRFNQSALSDLIDNDGIQRGISPDLKEAFIIEEKTINEHSLETDYIFPTVTGGRDVNKYLAEDIGKRVIYTKKTDNEKDIENIVQFISNFKNRITCTEVKQGKHPFWSLHRAREKSIFDKKEKILGVITGDKISVSIDTNKLYPTDGMYLFSSNGIYSNYFLVGLLNSKLLTYFYRLVSMEENRTLAQIKPSVLQNLPVSKEFNNEIVMLVETKTKEIIDKINANEPIEEPEKEINQLVYQLYNLTDKEIEAIEESVK